MVKKRKETFKLETHPQAPEESVIRWENYRFTVLTPAMIRLEYHPDGLFEDEATQTILNRNFPTPDFDLKDTDEYIEIITSHVHLMFYKEEGGFTKHNLNIEAIGNYSLYHSTWYFGDRPDTLKGTARTLDFVDGSIELNEGLMSKNGYAVIDDSQSMTLTEDGWVEKRESDRELTDMYFLGYGRDYLGTLKDYHYLTGKTPLLPRYALGNWWSRYYAYSQSGYIELMTEFEKRGIPLSVAVIDMDWHVTDVPSEYGSGWTGYTWNKELFPEPEGFLQWLSDHGLRTTLNLHPANGVQPYEEMYEPMAKELGVDYENDDPIEFDIANPDFLDAYFKYLHHPHEESGVDFWWIDWQQGSVTKVEGLDPLWMLNHYHFLDHGRNGNRPLIFSRYAGLGSHRYPIGFSGDTAATWDSLDFQPYFTSTASNVGYSWWSHDIGGHMGGVKDNELFVRWVQFGVFSPIHRLHSQDGEFSGKAPWRYGQKAERIVTDFMRLRHRMIPYLYTMNVLNHVDDYPLVRPMYYHYPWKEEAYDVPNQYYFGTQMIVAPITSPTITDLRLGKVKVWLPEGKWYDFFNNRLYEGDRMIDVFRPLSTFPVFVKAGGILPLDQNHRNHTDNPAAMEIKVYAGEDGSFSLYEDDGLGQGSEQVTTKLSFKWNEYVDQWAVLHIQAPEGNTDVLPDKRQFNLSLVGFKCQDMPEVYANDQILDYEISKDGKETRLVIPEQPIDTTYTINFKGVKVKKNDMHAELFSFLDRAQLPASLKEKVYHTIVKGKTSARVISALLALDLDPDLMDAISEIVWANPDDVA
ncbi:Maltodextrin glucosidase [Alkalibacterium sp. AK22]|uniref:glycoside hydrolase family 31 protein n=1 Tax=Alkalibacterium sp. AK22 TaxID=1229520 RepID=UPI00044C3AB5|nr:glycoside hydrolase family 31 protein [Alkalibacterium sp. AK22]EXJ23469.1 Maltodextrin glucosidase [Alkalibacterium sp. AK22]